MKQRLKTIGDLSDHNNGSQIILPIEGCHADSCAYVPHTRDREYIPDAHIDDTSRSYKTGHLGMKVHYFGLDCSKLANYMRGPCSSRTSSDDGVEVFGHCFDTEAVTVQICARNSRIMAG